jgi:hypothetical protein
MMREQTYLIGTSRTEGRLGSGACQGAVNGRRSLVCAGYQISMLGYPVRSLVRTITELSLLLGFQCVGISCVRNSKKCKKAISRRLLKIMVYFAI